MTVNAQETWLVTGAASGIGAAVVRAVRQAGHPVLALDVNDVAGQRLESETGAIYRHCNVADPADWRNPIYQVVDRDDVHVTVCAVRHFTAAPIEVIDLEWGDEFMIKSPGYRLGPAGA
ncbi:MAG: SDR family oxidoreductase [Gammaproteobacteria bacterium]|nr:SDR family oxidoreductase [Gammaproteobacteria bacterium]